METGERASVRRVFLFEARREVVSMRAKVRDSRFVPLYWYAVHNIWRAISND